MAFDGLAPAPVRSGLPSDPRLRLGVALTLAFGFAAVDDLRLVPAMLAVALLAVVSSGAGLTTVARRLRGPGWVALGLVLLLPLTVGETVLWQAGWLRLHAEGAAAALLVAARFLSIVAVVAAMLAPLPMPVLLRALRAVGVPAPMADLAMLLLRYLDEVRQEFARMRCAMALRGRPLGWRRLADLGWLLTALLLRAQARAERQWQAMRVRGYGAPHQADPWPPLAWADAAAVLAALGAAFFLGLAAVLA